MNTLKTDYVDAELAPTMDGKRHYMQVPNADGTFSIVDQTAYVQKGDNFGASDINATNQAVNELADSLNGLGKTELILNYTSSSSEQYVNQTLLKSLDNFKYILILPSIYITTDGNMGSSIIPVELFKAIGRHRTLAFDSYAWCGKTDIIYVDDTTIQIRNITTGWSGLTVKIYGLN